MAESTLSLGIDEYQVIVGRFLGLNATVGNWTSEETARVDRHIQAGVRQVYYPPAINADDPPHAWSFLRKKATGLGSAGSTNITDGVQAYDMPDDYGGGTKYVNCSGNSSNRQIRVVTLEEVDAQYALGHREGDPEYIAIHPKATALGATGQRFEAVVFPEPNGTVNVIYEYDALTDKLVTSTNPYPLGGMRYSELYKFAILAEAQYEETDKRGHWWDRFKEELARCIAYDKSQREGTTESFPNDATLGADGSANYSYMLRETGNVLGYGRSEDAWDTTQLRHTDSVVQRGYQRFNSESASSDQPGVTWDHLQPTGTITTANATQTYSLPTDCVGVLLDKITFGATSSPVSLVKDEDVRALTAKDPQTGTPQYASVRIDQTVDAQVTQAFLIALYPIPTGAATLTFKYLATAVTLGATNDTPRGDRLHGETILASCLALAELDRNGTEGGHAAYYKERLAASRSTELSVARRLGVSTFPVSETLPSTLGTAWDELTRLIGERYGYGMNPGAYTNEEIGKVDSCLQRSILQFYVPPKLPGEVKSYIWMFMNPTTSIVTVADDGEQDFPDSIAGVQGRITWTDEEGFAPARQVSEGRIRELLDTDPDTGRPQLFAIRPKTSDGSAIQVFELVWWRTPDDAYTGNYQYIGKPPRLDSSNRYPWGWDSHAEAIRASCIYMAEQTMPRNLYSSRRLADAQVLFMTQLQGAIDADKIAFTPEELGYLVDNSDERVHNRFIVHRNDITVQGVSPDV